MNAIFTGLKRRQIGYASNRFEYQIRRFADDGGSIWELQSHNDNNKVFTVRREAVAQIKKEIGKGIPVRLFEKPKGPHLSGLMVEIDTPQEAS